MARPTLRLLDPRRARERLRQPETRADLVQVLKTTVAAVGAWVLAVHVLDLQQAFLAPWAALLTVHATVYRSVWRGAQSVLATAVGILVSYLAVEALGYQLVAAPATAVAVLVGLLLARTPLLRQEGVAVATTALFVITAGYAAQEELLLHRFADTLVGVLVGIVVNVAAPPLDSGIARRAMEEVTAELGRLLVRMGGDLRADMDDRLSQEWIDATSDLDDRLDRAQEHLAFTRESHWANPLGRRSPWSLDPDEGHEVLLRLEDGVSQARAIARVVHESVVEAQEWDEEFRRRWTDLLREVGARVSDPDRVVAEVRPELDRLTRDMSVADLPDRHWPIYGALITLLLNVVAIVDDVASRPVGR